MEIDLQLDRRLFVPRFFPLLRDYSARFEIYMGSAGSAKSYFITQKLIVRALSQPIRMLVCRRYGTTLRHSCFALFKEVLSRWRLMQYVSIRETDFAIRFPNGSEIIFTGLDDEAKLLSLNDISTIFVEEAFEVSRDMFDQLNLRMRGSAAQQQIIAAFNPISRAHWLYDFCVTDPPENLRFIHSTYRDNPFLPGEYVAALEELRRRNPQKARVFCDGEWGAPGEGLVFANWRRADFDPMAIAAAGMERRAGMDVGFVDPTAIVDALYDRAGGRIYVFNEFYRSGCQLDAIAAALAEMGLRRTKVFCDSADARAIAFFRGKGFGCVPCVKGADSVRARILFLQNHEIVVHPSCENVLRELGNFSWRKDRNGAFTEDTTHEFSHALDALGYAFSDVYTQRRLKTLDKAVLGL